MSFWVNLLLGIQPLDRDLALFYLVVVAILVMGHATVVLHL